MPAIAIGEPDRPASYAVFTSVARTASPTPVEFRNVCSAGIHVHVDVTAVTSTPSVIFAVEYFDEGTQAWIALLSGVAVATVSTKDLWLFPGSAVSAGLTDNKFLPHRFRISATHGNANSITYTVGMDLLPS